MQVTYGGEHSLLIGDFVNGSYDRSGFLHTWEDLHLIPTTCPVIEPPPLKTNTVDIPGANGSIDMTEILLGRPLYENRTGSIDFYIDNTDDEYNDGAYRWDYAYDKVLNHLHGFKKKVILTDAMSYFYEGRVSVNSYKSDKLTGTISFDYDLAPYKSSICSTTERWLWDPFDFAKGIIVDQRMFKPYMTGSYAFSEIFKVNNTITGVFPQIPVLKATLNGVIDWDKTNAAGGSGFGIQPDGAEYRLWCLFKKTDVVYEGTSITELEIKTPITSNGTVISIGDPSPSYIFNFQYMNNFRNSDNEPIPVTYYFEYRPRRI